MNFVADCKNRVLAGQRLGRAEALALAEEPLEELTRAADELRAAFLGNRFDLCAIVNGKCGKCSEDCSYCAQSAHAARACQESYPLLPTEVLVEAAQKSREQGVLRFSIVTSGKRLSDREIAQVCESIRAIRAQTGVSVCVSFGLQSEEQFRRLKEAGAARVHCNLETSPEYFPKVCTTHTYEEKIQTLLAARRAGLDLCSGGILGLGETMADRIDLALTLRELEIFSIPMNLLQPISGTRCEDNPVLSPEELCRTVAVFRFLLPDRFLRLAGGRGQLPDRGEGCFKSGANAVITGDMLTTQGVTTAADWQLLKKLGYEVCYEEGFVCHRDGDGDREDLCDRSAGEKAPGERTAGGVL